MTEPDMPSGYCGSLSAHLPHRFQGPAIVIGEDAQGDVYAWRHCYGRRISAGSVARALLAAGIDPGDITGTPDDVVTVTGSTGARFALGDDGTGEGGEQRWTGTRYGAEDDVEGTESWTNLKDAAAAVAAWYEKSGGNGRT